MRGDVPTSLHLRELLGVMHGCCLYRALEAGHRREVTGARSAVVSSDVMVTPGCPHTDCRQSQCCPAPPRHHLAAAWLLSSCLDNVTCSGQHGVISASMFYISLSHFMDIFYAFYCFFFLFDGEVSTFHISLFR